MREVQRTLAEFAPVLSHEPVGFDDLKDMISAEARVTWSDNRYTLLCDYLDTLLDNDINRR
jgi:hypothetical protein